MIPFNTMGAIDQVIANSYVDAIRSVGVRNTWEFIPPDILILDLPMEDWSTNGGGFAVCNYTTIHKNLDTIPPDFYTLCFKKMCLGQVMIWIANIRSKYENLSTPFGQLPLNWMKLQEDGQRLLEEANQFLASIPPDKLIEVFD